MKQLTIYFDYGSPYSYLAWKRVLAHPERYDGVEVNWMPVSAWHLFSQDGNQPNAAFPNVLKYTVADLKRWANAYQVPLVIPDSFPARSIEASRIHYAAANQGEDTLAAWMEVVFDAHWGQGLDISQAAVLGRLAAEAGIFDPVGAVGDPEQKKRLIDATQAAYDAGAPGVPYAVLADGDRPAQGFWGNDRMAWVEAAIQGRVPTDSS